MSKRRHKSRDFGREWGLAWRLGFLIIVVVILFLVKDAILSLGGNLLDWLFLTFGAGTPIFFVATAVVLWSLLRRRFVGMLVAVARSFRRWKQWLAAVCWGLAGFGVLALLDNGLLLYPLGGSFGKEVIGSTSIWGILRLAALTFLGILSLTPRKTLQVLREVVRASLIALVAFLRFLRVVLTGAGLLAADATRLLVRGVKGLAPLWGRVSSWARERRRPEVPPPWEEKAPAEEKQAPLPIPEDEAPQPVEEVAPTAEKLVEAPFPYTPPAKGTPRKEAQPPVVSEIPLVLPLITSAGWQMPLMDMLEIAPVVEFANLDNEKRARLIEDALRSYGVEAEVVQINVGPTVTQFGLEPGWDRKYKETKVKDEDGNIRLGKKEISKTRVKVDRINSLANDLALALASPSIRIEAPVPGKPIVGVEVPNSTAGLVTLRGVMESAAFQRLKSRAQRPLALGMGAGGEPVVGDLAKMPHLLIAGATGAGKTVCLNAIIACLLMDKSPDEVRMIMVDPKRVELVTYNSIPHLINPVIVDSDKAVEALRWLNREMDRRFQKLAGVGARNIQDYNKVRRDGGSLPYLMLIVDELADLMMSAADEVERTLARLAQLARATGIHLVVATQRPSVDVVTGLIKANFPCRISFAVTSLVDSRTILDMAGAEKLLGKGDMLYLPSDAAKPKRLQGCFVSDGEMDRMVAFWALQPRPQTDTVLDGTLAPDQKSPADPLLDATRRLLQEHKRVSASFLARRLQIGNRRAEQLMEQLEAEEGSEPGDDLPRSEDALPDGSGDEDADGSEDQDDEDSEDADVPEDEDSEDADDPEDEDEDEDGSGDEDPRKSG